ncbi:MAG: MBL fold metallo-hydrolase [Candidatus Kariarchaeaceae archaeon]
MKFQALASGSNGNCSVLQTSKGSILIDAGISRRRIIKGITQLNIPLNQVKYILITHAHGDHIQGLPVLSDYLKAKVVATPDTIQEIRSLKYRDPRYEKVANQAIPIEFEETLKLDFLQVKSHPTVHDIAGASAYSVTSNANDFTLSYATDTNDIPQTLVEDMVNSDIIVIESNHDVNMLDKSRRPIFLKRRIKKTHLSNAKTRKILSDVISKRTKAVFLAHLSGDCNSPYLVSKDIKEFHSNSDFEKWNWIVCTRWDKSSLYASDMSRIMVTGGLCDSTFENVYKNRDLDVYFDNPEIQ